MAPTNAEGHELIKLSDSDEFRLEDQAQDIRGLDLYDSEGAQVGSVKDLYVNERERKVRFLDVGAEGFLGIGEKHFLIPVEAVSGISEDRVNIAQGREEVMGSLPFDTHVMPTADHQREAYEHYGYGYATEVPPGEEELRVRRIEEELRIGTREREAGSLSVRKQGRYTLSIPALAAQFKGIARHEANDYRKGTDWRNTFLNTLGHNCENRSLPSNSERVSNPSYRRPADSCWVLLESGINNYLWG